MNAHRNVKTVLAQTSPVHGDFRTRELKFVAGENRTTTTHAESGCKFRIDLATVYFSPRLSHERMRIASLVRPRETVVNMFAGVGCFSIVVAKHSDVAKVFSVDLNPEAVRLMRENIRLNGVFGKVIPVLDDAREAIGTRLRNAADRVLMPLPGKPLEYLPNAVSALKKKDGWTHCYLFEHARTDEGAVEKAKQKVTKLGSLHASFEIQNGRVVRSTGSHWFQIALGIRALG